MHYLPRFAVDNYVTPEGVQLRYYYLLHLFCWLGGVMVGVVFCYIEGGVKRWQLWCFIIYGWSIVSHSHTSQLDMFNFVTVEPFCDLLRTLGRGVPCIPNLLLTSNDQSSVYVQLCNNRAIL